VRDYDKTLDARLASPGEGRSRNQYDISRSG
jgi:hypothetical protein